MLKRSLVACIAFVAMSSQALPVNFSNWQLTTDAVAISDATPDVQSASGNSDLITSSAASIGNDVATAGAIAGAGLLSTSADVSGVGGTATSAVASAHYLGSFFSSGGVMIGIDFTSSSFASGSGSGGSTLFVTLMSGGATVFSDFLTAPRMFSYATAAGTTGTLELTLTSEANTAFVGTGAGGFSTSALVNVTTPVPEPETLLLLAFGLGGLVVAVKRRA